MIISHRHRCLFIEIPHTGSTAVRQQLRMHYGGEPILHKHATYSEFWRQASAIERRYYVFATVRNPLDTVVTDFSKYKTNHGGIFTDPENLTSAGGWVDEGHLAKFTFVQEGGEFVNYFRKFCHGVYHNWFLLGARRFDCVMRFENLNEEFMKVLGSLGVEPVGPLPVVNKTQRSSSFESYYTSAVYDQAIRYFGPFMTEWKYAFPGAWGSRRIPEAAFLRYRLLELGMTRASRLIAVAPRSRTVQYAKAILNRFAR